MKISDVIADIILDMFDDNKSTVQIQRNDLAARVGCVPSQINYVITSRFTPEQGYRIVQAWRRRVYSHYPCRQQEPGADGADQFHWSCHR